MPKPSAVTASLWRQAAIPGNCAGPSRPLALAPAQPPTQATILLVDDDTAVRKSLGRLITAEGWHVVSAASGEEALERLAERQPDLMITDLRMADVSGLDLLYHEYLQHPDLPIFVITALPPDEAGGAEHFAMEFFQKPLDLDALVSAIRRCLGKAQSTTFAR